ncbi:hypothetical protein [Brevifollis gellanilyticus]|nr:hypothetical protein [Brevifollis gellanilyticus]
MPRVPCTPNFLDYARHDATEKEHRIHSLHVTPLRWLGPNDSS